MNMTGKVTSSLQFRLFDDIQQIFVLFSNGFL